jgi:LysM repeat protein
MNITGNMTPSLRNLIIVAAFAWASSAPAPAQDVQADIQAIRKAVEQQNDQIARLTAEVARLAALVEGPRRGEAPAPAPAPAPGAGAAVAEAVRPPVVPPANVHVVVKGDSLDKIAKQHGVTIQDLQKLNRISDPKKLQIGQQLTLPPTAEKKETQPQPQPQPQ